MFNKIKVFSAKLSNPELPMGLFYTGLAMGLGLGLGVSLNGLHKYHFKNACPDTKCANGFSRMLELQKVESDGLTPSER
jgi:hypothetical protein